jgi:hypothetical protein
MGKSIATVTIGEVCPGFQIIFMLIISVAEGAVGARAALRYGSTKII